MWVAYHNSWSSIKIVANDLKQADSREAYYIRRAIQLNPEWSGAFKIKPSGYLVELPNNSRIEAVPVDPKGEAGGNDDLVIYTELWAAKSEAAQRMWTESTLSPTKFGKSLRWVETYAGFVGESPLLERLYDQGVNQGERIALEGAPEDLEVYVNREARLFCLWNTKPRLSWQTSEYYAQEEASLTPEEFARVHRNQWSTSTQAFVPGEWWDACQADLPLPNKREPLVVALDAGISSDCFAMVAVAESAGAVVPRHVNVWIPPKNGKLDFAEPQEQLEWLVKNFTIKEITYDPYQLHSFITEFQKKHSGITYYEFKQLQERSFADKALFDLIREGKIAHDGNPVLTQHVKNANRKDEGEKQLRIIKRQHDLKIDACVALSMAAYRIKHYYSGTALMDWYKSRAAQIKGKAE